jgi:DNA-directed RNA polymerase subunit M/transcription elongation factor TFIIS
MLFTLKGERYRHKKETIRDWMDKDRQMQEKYDHTPPPQNVQCQTCNSPTTITHKDLNLSYEPDSRMTFIFACVKCDKRQVLYEDGTEWKYNPPKCPKCKHPLKTDLKIKGDITTFTTKCAKCGYKNKDVDDHVKFRREQGAKEKGDKELLEKYRNDFCLSDKDGREYLEYTDVIEYATEVKNEEISKYDNSVYLRSIRLKKLSIVELEKLLSGKLEKENYIKFSFDKPEMGQFVIVPFSAQDANTSRKGYDSTNKLQKLIKTTLELASYEWWYFISTRFCYGKVERG